MKQGKSTKVTQLKNDYTQSKTVEAYRDHKHKRTLKRRVAGIMALASVLIISLGMNIFNNTRQLAQMDNEKVASAEELKQVEKTQENLEAETKKLEDEEYIAKLARSQYYLTKDGEIVFSFPEDNAAKTQEQEQEKEAADQPAED